MKYLTFLIFSTSLLAIDNCKDFPLHNKIETPYRGKITNVSRIDSFQNCPDSVFVNNKFIARLSKIITYKRQEKCVYTFSRTSFMCDK